MAEEPFFYSFTDLGVQVGIHTESGCRCHDLGWDSKSHAQDSAGHSNEMTGHFYKDKVSQATRWFQRCSLVSMKVGWLLDCFLSARCFVIEILSQRVSSNRFSPGTTCNEVTFLCTVRGWDGPRAQHALTLPFLVKSDRFMKHEEYLICDEQLCFKDMTFLYVSRQ